MHPETLIFNRLHFLTTNKQKLKAPEGKKWCGWGITKKRHLENIELEKDRLKTTAENDIIWRQTKERSQLWLIGVGWSLPGHCPRSTIGQCWFLYGFFLFFFELENSKNYWVRKVSNMWPPILRSKELIWKGWWYFHKYLLFTILPKIIKISD